MNGKSFLLTLYLSSGVQGCAHPFKSTVTHPYTVRNSKHVSRVKSSYQGLTMELLKKVVKTK